MWCNTSVLFFENAIQLEEKLVFKTRRVCFSANLKTTRVAEVFKALISLQSVFWWWEMSSVGAPCLRCKRGVHPLPQDGSFEPYWREGLFIWWMLPMALPDCALSPHSPNLHHENSAYNSLRKLHYGSTVPLDAEVSIIAFRAVSCELILCSQQEEPVPIGDEPKLQQLLWIHPGRGSFIIMGTPSGNSECQPALKPFI